MSAWSAPTARNSAGPRAPAFSARLVWACRLGLLLLLAAAPAEAADSDSWLNDSANWRLVPIGDFSPAEAASPRCLLLRANGDLLVGGGEGLAVLRQGRWLRYGFDPALGRLVGAEPGEALAPTPPVTHLTEDAGGNLWLVAGEALLRLVGPYDAQAQSWPLPGATGLAAFRSGVLATTRHGLRRFGRGGAEPLAPSLEPLAASPLPGLVVTPPADPGRLVLAITETGLVGWRLGVLRPLFAQPVAAALWQAAESDLMIVAGDRLLAAHWRSPGPRKWFREAVPEAELRPLGHLRGLTTMDVGDGPRPVVLAERGLAFLRDGHAQVHLLPDPPLAVAARRYAVFVLTAAGLWVAEPGMVPR